MVSINGLPPSIVPGSNKTTKTSKASKKSEVKKGQSSTAVGQTAVGQTTQVADAVSNSIRHVSESEIHRAQVQYDLPEGQSRKAMQEYLSVMTQSKREELAKLLGVDIYI
ncbi:chromosome partitioning protein ParA [Vibrio sp. ZSDE26]|uniref:Chromosome partitioning protein ParA n=1 Tax=Vibrio amylolyticus TaxID=2847292 RepID=A0A9X1XFJ8_9VIBR|nr:chromosome partitioning protein ParA [Vibrio amylolyticus]MCK6262034.1 chromosome partitioning protein ParA [Vibrio amylolyticus]